MLRRLLLIAVLTAGLPAHADWTEFAQARVRSRPLGPDLEISWALSRRGPAISVAIKTRDETVWATRFTTISSSRFIEVERRNFSLSGRLKVTFRDNGRHGVLSADKLSWTVKGRSGRFTGILAEW